MGKKLTKQEQMKKDGLLKVVGVLCNKKEMFLIEELQDLANKLAPHKRLSNSALFKFLLFTYGEDMKQQMINEIEQKERVKNECDF